MIHRLEPEPGRRLGESPHRNQGVFTLGTNIKLTQIFRFRAVGVLYLEDNLILVVGLLDQVDVVLRIGGAQKSLEFADGNAGHARAIAIDVYVEVWLVA